MKRKLLDSKVLNLEDAFEYLKKYERLNEFISKFIQIIKLCEMVNNENIELIIEDTETSYKYSVKRIN